MTNDHLLDGFMLKEKNSIKKQPLKKQEKDSFGDLFKEISSVKIQAIESNIKDINSLIQIRENLKKELFMDLEQAKMEINSVLSKVPIDATTQPAITAEHLKLRQKLIELEESKMAEKLNCWRDVASLKKELRENMREVQEKQDNLGILDNLIK